MRGLNINNGNVHQAIGFFEESITRSEWEFHPLPSLLFLVLNELSSNVFFKLSRHIFSLRKTANLVECVWDPI